MYYSSGKLRMLQKIMTTSQWLSQNKIAAGLSRAEKITGNSSFRSSD